MSKRKALAVFTSLVDTVELRGAGLKRKQHFTFVFRKRSIEQKFDGVIFNPQQYVCLVYSFNDVCRC
jgi:hypothetical protein